MIKKIYLDMDGVLTDFDAMIDRLLMGRKIKLPDEEFWKLIADCPNFWTDLALFPGAKALIAYVEMLKVPIEILTAPSRSDMRCYEGKILWLKSHDINFPINFARARYKRFYAQPDHLLIDDNAGNIKGWTEDGGLAILHKDLETTITQIKELL